MKPDLVAEFLKKRGAPSHVVKGGLAGLVRSWERTVEDLQRGFDWEVDEWLNDLDVRTMIHEISRALPSELPLGLIRRLSVADLQFLGATMALEGCVWGDENARENEWRRDVYWWLWRLPPGPESSEPIG